MRHLLLEFLNLDFTFSSIYLRKKSYFHLKIKNFIVSKTVKKANLNLIIPIMSHEIFWVLSITILHGFYVRVDSSEYASFAVASNTLDVCFVLLN